MMHIKNSRKNKLGNVYKKFKKLEEFSMSRIDKKKDKGYRDYDNIKKDGSRVWHF